MVTLWVRSRELIAAEVTGETRSTPWSTSTLKERRKLADPAGSQIATSGYGSPDTKTRTVQPSVSIPSPGQDGH